MSLPSRQAPAHALKKLGTGYGLRCGWCFVGRGLGLQWSSNLGCVLLPRYLIIRLASTPIELSFSTSWTDTCRRQARMSASPMSRRL